MATPWMSSDSISQLWLPEVPVERLHGWVNAATPTFMARNDSPAFMLEAAVGRRAVHGGDGRLVISSRETDEGWLHAIALEALTDGVGSLTINGASLESVAPFIAFTERAPGVPPVVSWFDPLRGIDGDERALSATLERHVGREMTFETFLFSLGWLDSEPLGTLTCHEGSPEPTVVWEPWAPYSPPPDDFLFERLGLAVAMALPLIIVAIMWASRPLPRTLDDAMAPAFLSLMLSGWLTFFPFEIGRERVMPWWARAIWFLGAPFAACALLFRLLGPV